MPGCSVSSLCLKSHMTEPQDNAANAVKMGEEGGSGLFVPLGPRAEGESGLARGMNEATTREMT